MNLQKCSLTERQKLTSHYPVLIVGSNSAGKSYSVEQLPEEEKKRTDVFNFDTKPIGEGKTEEFHNVYTVLSSSENIDRQIELITQTGKAIAAKDPKDPALKEFRDQVDKVVEKILLSSFNPEVDRLVTDTLTALTDFCESWAKENFDGREIWNAYGMAHQKILQAFKEATLFCYKYVYIMAHHDYIAPLYYPTTPKQVVKVKGGIMSGNVEAHFNTIVFTYVTQDGQRMFDCDVNNSLDTSRTKLTDSKFNFERNSLDDLEQIFAKNKTVVDGKLVEV